MLNTENAALQDCRPGFTQGQRLTRQNQSLNYLGLCEQWCPDSTGSSHAITTGVARIPAFQIGFVPTLVAQGLAEDAHGYGQASEPWNVASWHRPESPRLCAVDEFNHISMWQL